MSEAQPSAAEYGTQVTSAAIMQLGMALWGPKTLLSAIELGVFSALADAGALDGEALRERVGLHARGATDFFDALVALDMLEREDGRYTNTPATDLFLDQAKPSYIGGVLEMLTRDYGFRASLTESLRTGRPQIEAKGGEDFYKALCADPVKMAQFARVMTGSNTYIAPAIAAKFPWQDYSSVIDIGCAEGAVPVQIALAHKHITGGGFDLPPLGPIFEAYVAGFGLSERLSFTAGDFFTDPLPRADVLVMGHILHGWGINEKRLLLQNAYDALPEGGALIVNDVIIDDERRSNALGLLLSLLMLIATPGGFEYTGADCRAWMQEAGFRKSYVEYIGSWNDVTNSSELISSQGEELAIPPKKQLNSFQLLGPESMVVGIK